MSAPIFAEEEGEQGPAIEAPMDVEGAHNSAWSYLQDKYDADGDGAVSAAEYDRDEAAFARLDANGDGELSAQDFERRRPSRGQRGEGAGRPRRTAGAAEGEEAPGFTLRPLHLDPELTEEEQLVSLSAFAGDRPVALIFGSYT